MVLLSESSNGFQLNYNIIDSNFIKLVVYPIDMFEIPIGEHEVIEIYFDGVLRGSEMLQLNQPVLAGRNGSKINIQESAVQVTNFNLLNPYPNPFNPSITIGFLLTVQMNLELSIFDLQGRKMDTLVDNSVNLSKGKHEYIWDASLFPSGIYIARLSSNRCNQSIKIILIK